MVSLRRRTAGGVPYVIQFRPLPAPEKKPFAVSGRIIMWEMRFNNMTLNSGRGSKKNFQNPCLKAKIPYIMICQSEGR